MFPDAVAGLDGPAFGLLWSLGKSGPCVGRRHCPVCPTQQPNPEPTFQIADGTNVAG